MLELLLPLNKIDLKKRLIYGVMTAEAPDRSGEIFDYESGKAAVEKWSGEIAMATNGENLGNVREMHGKVAVGKVTDIHYDDAAKTIRICAKVVDDACWKKIEEHVYTGFSIGGGYAKRWQDPANKALKRYTPVLSEVSVVDAACLPGATIDMVKMDGSTETWTAPEDWAPTNEDVKKMAAEMATTAGKPDRGNDFVVQARDELIKRHAAPKAADSPEALLEAALAEADAALSKDAASADLVTESAIRVAWHRACLGKVDDGQDLEKRRAEIAAAWKATIDEDGPPAADKVEAITNLFKSGSALALMTAMDTVSLEKGFYTVGRVAHLLDRMSEIASGVVWEERWEEDTASTLPQQILNLMAGTRSFLIDMVNEETTEFFAQAAKDGGDVITLLAPLVEIDGMELAAKVTDLTKLRGLYSDEDLAKAGKRNSASDTKHIQAMHDHSQALGANCDSGNCDKSAEPADLAKIAEVQDELARARRTMAASIPTLQKLTGQVRDGNAALEALKKTSETAIADLSARLEALSKGPGTPKGQLYRVSRTQDGEGATLIGRGSIAEVTTPEERRQRGLEKYHARNGNRSLPAPGGGY